MKNVTTYDVVGVGIGPFNLGLAALLQPADDLNTVFFDAKPRFEWHGGMMLPGTTLQVPFLADLVTLADPASPFTFLNYLHERNRLYRFYFHETFHIARREYQAYCQSVAERLDSCVFGHRVAAVRPDGAIWQVDVVAPDGTLATVGARAVVFGVGGRPFVPFVLERAVADTPESVLHSADYLTYREKAVAAGAVTVVGSGQSAGEIVADLLETGLAAGQRLDWFTRGDGFLPMEYSKLGLEHFTPEYADHFHGLPAAARDQIRAGQDLLYKGLSAETSARIYELLYEATIDSSDPPVSYAARCELVRAGPSPVPGRTWRLGWRHRDEGREFSRDTDVVVLATGYRPADLPIADGVVERDDRGRPIVDRDYRLRLAEGRPSTLFVQNAELHTHGVGAPDLGLGAYRSSVIANAVAGRELYRVPRRTVFQRFGVEEMTR